jgi:hypothetical protein
VYLRTPRNDWHETANERIRDYTKELEQQCDPFWLGGIPHKLLPGDWQDYVAGEEQALQDVAASRAPLTTAPAGLGRIECD